MNDDVSGLYDVYYHIMPSTSDIADVSGHTTLDVSCLPDAKLLLFLVNLMFSDVRMYSCCISAMYRYMLLVYNLILIYGFIAIYTLLIVIIYSFVTSGFVYYGDDDGCWYS